MIEFANLLVLAANRESYWKYAYEVCGLELSTKESSTQYKQIDNYWSDVGKLVGEDVTKVYYSPLLNVYYRYLMDMLFLKKIFQ